MKCSELRGPRKAAQECACRDEEPFVIMRDPERTPQVFPMPLRKAGKYEAKHERAERISGERFMPAPHGVTA